MIVRSQDEDEEETGLQREIQIWNTLFGNKKNKKERRKQKDLGLTIQFKQKLNISRY